MNVVLNRTVVVDSECRLSVSVAVGVSSNKVRVVIVLTKNIVKIISLVL